MISSSEKGFTKLIMGLELLKVHDILHGLLPAWRVVSRFGPFLGSVEGASVGLSGAEEVVLGEGGVVGLELKGLHRKYNRFSSSKLDFKLEASYSYAKFKFYRCRN